MAAQKDIAEHLDLSDRQVRRLLADGLLPSSKGPSGYDLDACRMAYIRYLRGLGNGQVKADMAPPEEAELDPSAEEKLLQQKLRLTAAQADGQELKNDISRRRSVPVDFAMFVLSGLAAEVASILDTLPLTMRRRHPELEPRHQETLERELAKARNRAAGLDERLPGLLDEYLASPD